MARPSHFGPPTAPSSTASARRALPASRPAAASRGGRWRRRPRSALSKANGRSRASSMRTACGMISAPMPSPGSTSTRWGHGWELLVVRIPCPPASRNTHGIRRRCSASNARMRCAWPRVRPMSSSPSQQQSLAFRLDVEIRLEGAAADGLRHQIDGEFEPFSLLDRLEQRIDQRRIENHQEQPVLLRVGEEDVREARRQDAAEAVLLQGPHRVFAAGAAAEVVPGEQDCWPRHSAAG